MQFSRLVAYVGLPLLAKELLEQAARKRTYIVRVVYAALLFFAASLFFYETLKVGTASPLAVLGRGKDLFAILVGLQFAGIYSFMPAMTCAVLTHEKERASLQLLFLTRLGPWTILFEKLTSRLIPMFGFLLLSLPLLAFAYTLGGDFTRVPGQRFVAAYAGRHPDGDIGAGLFGMVPLDGGGVHLVVYLGTGHAVWAGAGLVVRLFVDRDQRP